MTALEWKLSVDFWNVGQGDATSIRLPSGELMLIDVGPRNSTLSQWLRSQPRGPIRDVFLTHNDSDHAGALPELVADPIVDIKRVCMVEDRDKSDPVQSRLFRTVFDYSQRRGFEVGRLECPPGACPSLWSFQNRGLALTLRHPSFKQNVQSRSPNSTSAILTLDMATGTLIAWPGDAKLARTVEVIDSQVSLLLGPHHGAPQDNGKAILDRCIDRLGPNDCLISVGTNNGHSHPKPQYIKTLALAGCRVSCTQMTLHCDRERVNGGQHVMNSSGYLGLPAPGTGVFCRGHVRLAISPEGIEFDRYHDEHRERLEKELSRGRRLLCLMQ